MRLGQTVAPCLPQVTQPPRFRPCVGGGEAVAAMAPRALFVVSSGPVEALGGCAGSFQASRAPTVVVPTPVHLRGALTSLVLPFVVIACGGRTTLEEDVGFEEDAGFEEGDGGLGVGDVCDTSEECAEGLLCLYWDPGCDRRGVCGVPPLMDAFFSCRGVCDCSGQWRGNIGTLAPFQSREWGPSSSPSCSPPDASVPDGWDPFVHMGSECRACGSPICSDRG